MKNLEKVAMFRIPVKEFVLDKDYTIHIGDTKFLYNDNKYTTAKTIYNNFFNGMPIKVKYDVQQDDTIFIEFEITYLPKEKMLEGKLL